MRAAGARGPTEISDPVARERISHFDHERIPGKCLLRLIIPSTRKFDELDIFPSVENL